MTILVDVAVVGAGILLGRWIMRSVRASRAPQTAEPRPEGGEGSSTVPPFEGLPCSLGDVVVRVAQRDEAWLAGALVFEEARPCAVLFIAPEAGGDRGLYARHAQGAGLVWLAPVEQSASGGEPPHVIERDGQRYERTRRLPVRVRRLGTGAPDVGAEAVVAEYSGSGGARLVVVAGAKATLTWAGEALAEGEFDVLPGGGEST
jgi:hypothetical protein